MKFVVAAILAGMVISAAPAASADGAPPGRYGIMGDLGLPDGMVGSFAYRAHQHVGAHVGLGHNTNSFGLRAGAAWLPLAPAVVAPYLALEGGLYFSADTAGWLRSAAKSAGLDDKTLERLGYRYANLHLGARFGRGAAAFYIQGGVSFISATAGIIKPKPNYEPPVDLYRETVVHVWTLSGRAGLVYFF